MKVIWNYVIVDLKQFFRQKMELASTLLTSVSMLLAFGLGTGNLDYLSFGASSYFAYIAPGAFAIGIMFSSTFTMGYGTILDKQRRFIDEIITSPMSYSSFLIGRYTSMLFKCFLQIVLLIFIAVVIFDSEIHHIGAFIFACVNIVLFFSALGIFMAVFTNEVSFSSVSNYILIPLFFFSGVFFPLDGFGELAKVLIFLPLSSHVLFLRYSMLNFEYEHLLYYSILTLFYSGLMIAIAAYAFKNSIKNN